MFHINDAKRALGAEVIVSSKMQAALDLWCQMYTGEAPWLNSTTQSLGLPAAIANEFGRLVLVEFKSEVTGSARADYLEKVYSRFRGQLRNAVEIACASGGCVFKPYIDEDLVVVDCVPAWRFYPTAYNARGEVTGAVFVEQTRNGSAFYTRMEMHELTDDGYTVRNLAFRSLNAETLGTQCSLDAVPEWSTLEPELTIRYKDGSSPEGMLFAYFKMPAANTEDLESPLGVSVYSNAVDLVKEADRQYSRLLWEFEGSELAVDVSVGAFSVTKGPDGKPRTTIPERKKRLFRELAIDQGNSGDLFKVFSPTIRDQSILNGLDKILKRVEFNCSLAYGTLSDPQSVEKTAEEIKSSKQRSYTAVCDIQQALEQALRQLLWCMDFYASLYKLAPRGEYEVSFTWGDGVLEDTDKEFVRRKALVDEGYLKPEELIAWYFGVDEETAKAMMPAQNPALRLEL